MKASSLLLFPALLFASCATDTAMDSMQKFQRADADGDGSVSRAEATNLFVADAFALYDADGDGVVTAEEYAAAGGKEADLKKLDTTGSGDVSLAEAQAHPDVIERMALPFDEADVNGDGKVSYEEYLAYTKRLEAVVR